MTASRGRRTLNAVRPYTVIQTERLRAPNRVVRGGCLEKGNPEKNQKLFSMLASLETFILTSKNQLLPKTFLDNPHTCTEYIPQMPPLSYPATSADNSHPHKLSSFTEHSVQEFPHESPPSFSFCSSMMARAMWSCSILYLERSPTSDLTQPTLLCTSVVKNPELILPGHAAMLGSRLQGSGLDHLHVWATRFHTRFQGPGPTASASL